MDCIPLMELFFAEKRQLGRFWDFFEKKGAIETGMPRRGSGCSESESEVQQPDGQDGRGLIGLDLL